jgi:predicted TIM-barrel fold metal-dependent hydrolase
MVDPLSAAARGDVHVGDWTLVRVPERVTAPERDALVARVRQMLRPGARVAVDTRHLHLDNSEMVDALRALSDAASGQVATVAFVVPDADVRSALVEAGVRGVHASLDAAVGDSAPARFDDGPAGLAPAAGDTQLVATEDLLGRDPDRRA